jgi:CheY-like chemotaxis protein
MCEFWPISPLTGTLLDCLLALGAHPEVAVIGEAQDGLDAIEKIEELRPDLLFLDIEMPGLRGFEVLRSIPSAIEIPLVIFTTGYRELSALSDFVA